MFDAKSRYLKADTQVVVDSRGREVTVVVPPQAPRKALLGVHLLKQGERIDHLAAKYVNDAAGYWRIAERNDVMLPDALALQREIEIPVE